MSKSIVDFSGVDNIPRFFSESADPLAVDTPAGSVGSLDIHRDFPTVQNSKQKKITEKTTPDKTFSLEEKRKWKKEQDKILQKRECVARSIVLDYVNNVDSVAEGLDPMAAFAAMEEEKMVRRSQLCSFLKCLRKNNHSPIDLVRYDDGESGSVAVSGVWRCGSLWQCPRCASYGLWQYKERIEAVLRAIQRENNVRRSKNLPCLSVLFATFTAPHSPGDSLGDEMRVFSDVWRRVMDSRPVRDIRERCGFVGSVRCYDHTITFRGGLTDWHTHFHNLLIFDPMEGGGVEIVDGSPFAASVSDVLFTVWADRIRKITSRKCSPDAFRVEVVSLVSDERSESAVADYAAKVFCLPGYMTKSQKERSGEVEQPGPPFRSLAPFDLLDAYSVWGNNAGYDYAVAWIEYCVETKGFHRVQFSKGLEKRLGIERKEKRTSLVPLCRHTLPGPVADVALTNSDVLADLKEAILADDVVLFYDVLKPLGLAWAADEVAEEKPVEARSLTDSERALARFRLSRSRDLSELLEGWGVPVEKEVEVPVPVFESLFFGGNNEE